MNNFSTTIHRLNIKAAKSELQNSVRELEQYSWPEINDEWLFVRNLQVSASTQDLARQTGDSLKSLIHSATDGRSATAIHANVVKFPSLPCMLAFLLRDVLLGRLSQTWYWKQWTRLQNESPSNAIARIFYEHHEQLPAIVAELVKISLLPKIWINLSEQAAAQVLTCFPSAGRTSDKGESEAPLEETQQQILRSAKQLLRTLKIQQPNAISQWRLVAESLTPTDMRMQLASAVLLRQYFPNQAAYLPNTEVAKAIYQVLLEESNQAAYDKHEVTRPSTQSQDSLSQTEERVERRRLTKATEQANTSLSTQQKSSQKITLKQAEAHKAIESPSKTEALSRDTSALEENIKVPESFSDDPNKISDNQSQRHDDTDSFDEESSSSPYISDNFITQCGGVFYLINALRMTIGDKWPWENSPWLWLYDAMKMFECEVDKPLQHFLANQALLDVDALGKRPINPSLIQWRQKAPKNIQPLLNQSLIEAPCQVRYSPSHIDTYFPMNAIRLDVRMAGLDINPDWVPWLGRVVKFYYREQSHD